MVICIILSAYFSATETAFSSLNKTKIKTMAEKGQKRAKLVCNLVDEYDKLISTILIGNNIVNILLSSIGTVLFVKIYGNIGATISTVVVTIVVLIFGEITPKSIAKDFPEKFAVFSAPLINFFIIIFTPDKLVIFAKYPSPMNLGYDSTVKIVAYLSLITKSALLNSNPLGAN